MRLSMRRPLLAVLLLLSFAALLLLPRAAVVHAQNAAAKTAGAQVTKEEVDSFMRHTFGWNPDLKWQVGNIGPSDAAGVTEANVTVETAQGQQMLVLFVTPDGKYAINGDMVPFGADPFAPAREQLKGA